MLMLPWHKSISLLPHVHVHPTCIRAASGALPRVQTLVANPDSECVPASNNLAMARCVGMLLLLCTAAGYHKVSLHMAD